MKIKLVLSVLAYICLVVSGAMLIPLILALYDGSNDTFAFTLSIAIGCIFSGMILYYTHDTSEATMGIREGAGITGFSWLVASFVGALPYWLSGYCGTYTDAFFETMSGFTTTGATILNDIEALPRGLLLWRCLTHWMGGMGIIVLSLAVLPFLGVSGMAMYKAEVPGVEAGKVTPRLHQTAVRLWGVYVFLTLSEAILLILGGMTVFDAICHSFSTIATGGFSTKNSSIAFYHSPYIRWVIIIFMFLSGVNFSLYFLIPQKKYREIFRDEELRGYVGVILVAVVIILFSFMFNKMYFGFEHTLRRVMLHVVSIITTTGFIAEDFDKWPELARMVFLVIMFIGASGGSTGGGCKVSRFIILWRNLKAEISRLIHPRAIITSRMNGKPIPKSTTDSTTGFFVVYFALLMLCTLITTAYNIDIMTAFSGVLTCLSNVGPGLNLLGAVESFSWLPDGVKWLFSFCMYAGRLELFAVLLLFMPSTYRK